MSKLLSVPALLVVLLVAGCGSSDQTATENTDESAESTNIPDELVAPQTTLETRETTLETRETTLETRETTLETREEEPTPSRAPTVYFTGGDTTWATDFDQLAKKSTVIVHVDVSTPALQIGASDPLAADPIFAINQQSVQVLEVLKDDFGVAKTGATLEILMTGPNMNNKTVAASVEAGTARLSDDGLAVLQNGQYVLLLVPSAVSQDPNLSFEGTFTPPFDYQSILPVNGDAIGPAGPLVFDDVLGVSLRESAVTELRNNFELRPAFELPATMTELRDEVLRLTDLAGQEE